MTQNCFAIFIFLFFLVKKRNKKDKAAPIALPALLNCYKSQECGRLKRSAHSLLLEGYYNRILQILLLFFTVTIVFLRDKKYVA